MRMKFCFIVICLLFCGCYKNYLYVQQEYVNASYLASSHVQTPDPRKENPPSGQRIIISWDFPLSIYRQKLEMTLTVRFWDNTEEERCIIVDNKRGYFVCNFFDQESEIITYKIDVKNALGDIVQAWKHQFWVEAIDLKHETSF